MTLNEEISALSDNFDAGIFRNLPASELKILKARLEGLAVLRYRLNKKPKTA